MRYATPAAFRRALEARLLERSRATGLPLVRLRRMVVFERLLARLLETAPNHWVLKGGLALDYRFGSRARTTKDMDLGRHDGETAATADLLAAQRCVPGRSLGTDDARVERRAIVAPPIVARPGARGRAQYGYSRRSPPTSSCVSASRTGRTNPFVSAMTAPASWRAERRRPAAGSTGSIGIGLCGSSSASKFRSANSLGWCSPSVRTPPAVLRSHP
jgi:hypothetical protein